MSPELLILAGAVILGNGGIAWISVKAGLNGIKEDTTELKKDFKDFRETLVDHGERIIVLETKLEQ